MAKLIFNEDGDLQMTKVKVNELLKINEELKKEIEKTKDIKKKVTIGLSIALIASLITNFLLFL